MTYISWFSGFVRYVEGYLMNESVWIMSQYVTKVDFAFWLKSNDFAFFYFLQSKPFY